MEHTNNSMNPILVTERDVSSSSLDATTEKEPKCLTSEVGGRMVYSTCSLNPIEDEAVLYRLLQETGDAVGITSHVVLITIWPDGHSLGGFWITNIV